MVLRTSVLSRGVWGAYALAHCPHAWLAKSTLSISSSGLHTHCAYSSRRIEMISEKTSVSSDCCSNTGKLDGGSRYTGQDMHAHM